MVQTAVDPITLVPVAFSCFHTVMPDGTHESRRKQTLIRLPIGELAGWHLLVSCGACRADRVVHVRDLVAQYGSEQRLVMLMPRLRCREAFCRRPPSHILLRSRFPASMGGPAMVEIVLKA